MPRNTLAACLDSIRRKWGPISSEVVAECQSHMAELARAASDEPWLAELHRDAPASRELYRDNEHGFVLQAHCEGEGVYRAPHDHGHGWVIYAVQQGKIEMGSYARLEAPYGSTKLVKRDATVVRPGMALAYLPGDIHDTLCLRGPALLFRFTDRDLREETRAQRMTRYVDCGGVWKAAAA